MTKAGSFPRRNRKRAGTGSTAGPGGSVSPAALAKRGQVARFIGITLTLLVGFFFLIRLDWVENSISAPYTRFVAACSRALLRAIGTDVEGSGSLISSSNFAVNILHVCNGLEAVAIFFAVVLAFPAPPRSKLVGIAIGFPALFVVNLVRIAVLFMIGAKTPDIFESVHYYYSQALVILITVIIWLVWVGRIVPNDTEKPDSHTA